MSIGINSSFLEPEYSSYETARLNSVRAHDLAQLRHLYAILASGSFKDSKQLANGLLAPVIRNLEK